MFLQVFTKGDTPGKAGLNYGTGYFPTGDTAGKKAGIALGLMVITGGGAFLCVCVLRFSPVCAPAGDTESSATERGCTEYRRDGVVE